MLKTTLFRIARGRAASFFIGYAFEYFCGLIPLERHHQTRLVVVFTHPVPSYPLHLLAVPRKRIPSFMHLDLDDPAAQGMALAIFEAIQVTAYQKALTNYRVIVNGGAYQEAPQLHCHILRGDADAGLPLGAEPAAVPPCTGAVVTFGSALAYPQPAPEHKFQRIIAARQPVPGLHALDFSDPDHASALLDMLRAAQALIARHSLSAYRLVLRVSSLGDIPNLWFQLVSGDQVVCRIKKIFEP